ncbi:sensor histidine kinase [Primorskyibacter sp. 2E107]|uniref:sensor histidine kinase n=1 Tax=Primorskyibacter sp. 2E107 TaxID=3403458 RepID=UPI003AF81E9E
MGDLVSVAVFGATILYFGTSHDPVFVILAFLLFAGFYMHSLGERSQIMMLLSNDILLQAVVLALQVVWIWRSYLAGEHPAVFTLGNTLIMMFGILGLHVYFLMLCRSIRRTRRQVMEAQERRIADERLLAIGQLSGGIAHDFNNMLTAVLGNIELMRLTENHEERQSLMDEAEVAARSGANLTAQLLAYAGRAHLRPRKVDLVAMVNESVEAIKPVLKPKQTLRVLVRNEADLPPVLIDAGQFTSVLEQLLDNAADATPDDGVITVTVRGLGPKGASVEVRDTGTGISAEILPLVFEPYFTTKPKGHGTGLGLAMARGIIEQSGGQLKISSESGVGTDALITLPAANTPWP